MLHETASDRTKTVIHTHSALLSPSHFFFFSYTYVYIHSRWNMCVLPQPALCSNSGYGLQRTTEFSRWLYPQWKEASCTGSPSGLKLPSCGENPTKICVRSLNKSDEDRCTWRPWTPPDQRLHICPEKTQYGRWFCSQHRGHSKQTREYICWQIHWWYYNIWLWDEAADIFLQALTSQERRWWLR